MRRFVIAAVVLGSVLVGSVSANSVSCLQHPATRLYAATLFMPDYDGRPDMDTRNDHLVDVPKRCRALVLEVGELIVDAYSVSY